MIKSFKFADNKPYNKNTYPIKELMSHGGDRNYIAPQNNKPYCIAVREDFKLIAKKAKEEMNKAYTRGFSPNYVLSDKERQPKFELKDGILAFVDEK